MGFLRFAWWRDVHNRDGATALTSLLKVVVPAVMVAVLAVAGWFGLKPDVNPDINQPSIRTGNNSPVNSNSGTQVTTGDRSTVAVVNGLTEQGFLDLLQRRETQVRQDLERAHASEQELLRRELAEIERQKADLDTAYAQTVEQLRELRSELEAFEGRIPDLKLQQAQQALIEGDPTLADRLLAEVQNDSEDAVQVAAQASFTRGRIAEQEIRWADAANHYARAAQLDPSFDTLLKAREFAERAGNYDATFRLGADLLAIARAAGNNRQVSIALNAHAIGLYLQERYAEAQTLLQQGLDIDKDIIGNAHPDYSTGLYNLATVFKAQGRLDEAEELARQALNIDKETIGTNHPGYAIGLNNLAAVLENQGRYAEAEVLYRKAIYIDENTIGTDHPAYASRLNNLALTVLAQGRLAEAEELVRQALNIDENTIGTDHPAYAIHLNNLALTVQSQGRMEEAGRLYRQALQIFTARLPRDHSYILSTHEKINALEAGTLNP